MNTLKLILLALFVVIPFNSCFSNNSKSTTDIEGFWISTLETSDTFSSGIFRYVFHISRDQSGKLTARSVFILNGDYSGEWRFVDFKYDKLTRRINMVDVEGNTFEGMMDNENKMITGAIHLKKSVNNFSGRSLDLERADESLGIALFFPRIPDRNGNIVYSYKTPEQLDDGLETASIHSEGIDSVSVNGLIRKIINQKYGHMESLLILKDNKLIVEEYFYGHNRTHLRPIFSCTKSITSLILGIALEHHENITIDQSLFSFFPEYGSLKTEEKGQITLKHALTMTAGFQWNEHPGEQSEPDDWFQYILSRPMEARPGEKFLYNSGCSTLLGGVIDSLEGKNAQLCAEEFLFGPLGISEYTWETHQNGMPNCGSGVQLLPRDMAKIGLLVLNDGKWLNEQIVPKEWILESTKPHVPESKFFNYGYHWWHRSKDNKPWWEKSDARIKDENDMIVALGSGGQYIMIIGDLNMVVVTTASDHDNGSRARSKIPMVVGEIAPLFMDSKL